MTRHAGGDPSFEYTRGSVPLFANLFLEMRAREGENCVEHGLSLTAVLLRCDSTCDLIFNLLGR